MNPIRLILPILLATAWSSASAETMRFEDAMGMLGTSCAKDIDANCRGVNPDTRLKDCLTRNQDVLSLACKNDYLRAFDAIQKRVSARSAVTKLCERDVAKFCGGGQKGERRAALDCPLPAPPPLSIHFNKAPCQTRYSSSL